MRTRLPITHATDWPFAVPVKVWPNVCAATTVPLADKQRFYIGKSHTVGPTVGVEGDVMAAMAVDQDATQAHRAHLAEGDLHRPAVGMRGRGASRSGHAAIEVQRGRESNCRLLVCRNARELLRIVAVEDSAPQKAMLQLNFKSFCFASSCAQLRMPLMRAS